MKYKIKYLTTISILIFFKASNSAYLQMQEPPVAVPINMCLMMERPHDYINGMIGRQNGNAVYLYNHFNHELKTYINLYPKNIILFGPSGTGKTFFVETLAKSISAPLIKKSVKHLTGDKETYRLKIINLIEQMKLIEDEIEHINVKSKPFFILITDFDDKFYKSGAYEYYLPILYFLRLKYPNLVIIYESTDSLCAKEKAEKFFDNIFDIEFEKPKTEDRKEYCENYFKDNNIISNKELTEVIVILTQQYTYTDLKKLLNHLYKDYKDNLVANSSDLKHPSLITTLEAIYRIKGKEVPRKIKVHLGLVKDIQETENNFIKELEKEEAPAAKHNIVERPVSFSDVYDVNKIITVMGTLTAIGTGSLITALVLKCKLNKIKKQLEKEKQEKLIGASTKTIK